jgi:hypothetical protein
MRKTLCIFAFGSVSFLACQRIETSTASKSRDSVLAQLSGWASQGKEVSVCPSTEITMADNSSHSREVICAVVSRAWAAAGVDPKFLAAVLRDKSGLPRRAEVHFARFPDISDTHRGPPVVYWDILFPGVGDSFTSVQVDSSSGVTHVSLGPEWRAAK